MNKKFKIYFSFFLTAGIFSIFSCASWLQGKVDMNTDSNIVSISELFKKTKELESLKAPRQLYVSQALYSGKINLTWSPVENATSYLIERAVVKNAQSDGTYLLPDESEYEVCQRYVLSTSFQDEILTNPAANNEEYSYHYFYRIYAENKEKNLISEATNRLLPETRGEGWLFAPPTKIDAQKGKSVSKIEVSWTKVKESVRYEIYRGETPSSVAHLKTVYANTLKYSDVIASNLQGKEFFYKVVAINRSGNKSAFSDAAMGYSLSEGAPAISSEVKVVDGFATSTTELNISWQEVAKTSENAVMTYNLYRTSSEDSVYTRVAGNLSTTSYKDTSLKIGLTYYYFVQAVSTEDGVSIKGAFSEISATSYGFLLSPPSFLEVEDGDTDENVFLVWSDAVGSKKVEYSYSIYISHTQDGAYQLLEGSVIPQKSDDGYLRYKVAKNPFYKVSTQNLASTGDKESALSSVASPMPAAPVEVTATKTDFMQENLLPNSNNVYPVKISWKKPQEDNPAGYVVYRSIKNDSGFRKLTSEPIQDLEFVDEGKENLTKAGVVYYYKVVSVNSLGQGKKGNNPKEEYENAISNGMGISGIKCLGYGALTREQWFREYNKTSKNSQTKLTLMHKASNLDKLGSETINGSISGTLHYNARASGFSGIVEMRFENYADFYINDDKKLGVYFNCTGNSNTRANVNGNGNMYGIMDCTGMYPGSADYGGLEIKGSAAGGGVYKVTVKNLDGKELLSASNISWLVGEE